MVDNRLDVRKEPEPTHEPFELAGTWDIVCKDKVDGDVIAEFSGVLTFDPEGGTSLEFDSGWSTRGFSFEVDGSKVTGVVPDQGYLSINVSGDKGSGKMGVYEFEMSRRKPLQDSAAKYAAGTWDLLSKHDQERIAKVTLSADLKGKLEHEGLTRSTTTTATAASAEGGVKDDSWTYTIDEHSISSDQSIPGAGKLRMTFTPDGTLGIATLDDERFEVVRVA